MSVAAIRKPATASGAGANGNRYRMKTRGKTVFFALPLFLATVFCSLILAEGPQKVIQLGLSEPDYEAGKEPAGWRLRKTFGPRKGARAEWVIEDGIRAVKLQSRGNLTFLEKRVDIDLKRFPVVSWKWKVENILDGIDERSPEEDDHPIRIFFVLDPDTEKQSLGFRLKRFLYLDRAHGHPMGGRFTEYLWSSHLQTGDIIEDPRKPHQKLMVIEGGTGNLGRWLSYKRNLYEDFKNLYRDEPRRLIFIGVLNDTDQTGQEAVSYIADLGFEKE